MSPGLPDRLETEYASPLGMVSDLGSYAILQHPALSGYRPSA